jgi:ATP-dependent DNA helicase 2 subunit 1
MPLHFPAKTTSAGDGIALLEALLTTINVRNVSQRALFTLPLELGIGCRIGVKGYAMIKRQEILKTCWVWVGGDELQVATGHTTTIAEDTARTVTKGEIRKAYPFGGEHLFFDDDEMKWLRYFGEPEIRIIGFKPLSMLPTWANTRTAVLLRAEESNYVGSSRVYSALYQKLFADQKFALTWSIIRRNAMPVLAALVPGAEKLHDSDEQYVPGGLWFIPLPYRDDIRQAPETPLVRAPSNLVNRMKLVLNQMRLPGETYDPRKYPNPGQLHRLVFILTDIDQAYSGSTRLFRHLRLTRMSLLTKIPMTRQSLGIGRSKRSVCTCIKTRLTIPACWRSHC